jgi:DNA-binding transcriptional regulator GbsR (MarR family)
MIASKGANIVSQSPLDPAKLAFIEEMGTVLESFALSRMAGRVLGALLVAEPPEQSGEDLAAVLGASRSAVSVATQLLEKIGYIERIRKRGDRKDYFRHRPQVWEHLFAQQFRAVRLFREMAEKGLSILASEAPETRRGLEDMRDFYHFFEVEHPMMLARWRESLESRSRSTQPWGKQP